MGQGVGASSGLQSLFPARHDGGGLRMKRNSQAMLGDDLETLEHGAGRRRRQIAEGVAHEAFESGNAPLDQRLQLIDIVLREQAVATVIDLLYSCDLLFER